MARASGRDEDFWPGRRHRGTVCRLYLDAEAVEADLPADINGVVLAASANVRPLPGDAAASHDTAPYLLECQNVESGDAMVVLQGALDALTLGSEVSFRRRVLVALEEGRVHTHSFERDRTWGPSVGRIDNDAVAFVKAHGGRIVSWIRSETFNRVANAFRLYSTAVHAESPDAALVLLMSCLEGLLTTAADNISFRLSLAVASLMDDAPENRLRTFQRARAIYTARSKIVHGAALSKDEERSAILLVDNILPEAEEFARHALRKILADGLVDVFATSERAERFVVMLALGYEAARAAALA